MEETQAIRAYRDQLLRRWWNHEYTKETLPPPEKPAEYEEWVRSLHKPGGSEGPDDPSIAAWYGDCFIVDDTFHSTDELRALAGRIDAWNAATPIERGVNNQ
jgi:hypothetical protein